jgi:hypothetical protein
VGGSTHNTDGTRNIKLLTRRETLQLSQKTKLNSKIVEGLIISTMKEAADETALNTSES